MKGLIEQDALRHELRMALIWSFARAGYSNEESSKLAEIAIGPVDQALKCAKAIYNLKFDSVMAELPKINLIKDMTGIVEAQNEKVIQLQELVQKLQIENDALNKLLAERWEQILNFSANQKETR